MELLPPESGAAAMQVLSRPEPRRAPPLAPGSRPSECGAAPATPSSAVPAKGEGSLGIGIADFDTICLLGRGAYGKVHLVRCCRDGRAYALKVIGASEVAAKDMAAEVLSERAVLASFASEPHPRVARALCAFRSGEQLCVAMPFYGGGTLLTRVAAHEGGLPESDARDYAAQLVEALGALHARGILYLDLKLENVMLDARGDVALVDFGFSQLGVDVAGGGVARRLGGSRAYLSPEACTGEAVGGAADWWALGILTYEMLFGSQPFGTGAAGADRAARSKEIVGCRLRFPDPRDRPAGARAPSSEAKALCRKLLAKAAAERLGSAGGAEEVRGHAFFRHVDWAALRAAELEPPHAPGLAHEADVSHFDTRHTRQTPPRVASPFGPPRPRSPWVAHSVAPSPQGAEAEAAPAGLDAEAYELASPEWLAMGGAP